MAKCPRCGISNIETATLCDCGHVLKENVLIKRCPACGGINLNDARRCRYCKERLRISENIPSNDGLTDSPATAFQAEVQPYDSIPRLPLTLKDLSSGKLAAIIMLLPAAIILLDAIIGYAYSSLLQEFEESSTVASIYAIYIAFGIWAANYLYKLKKTVGILISTCSLLFIYRFVIVRMFKPDLMGQAIMNTLKEAFVIYLALAMFISLFRHFEPKYDYAEIRKEFESQDPISRKKIRKGMCNRCGAVTLIGKERSISFLGMSSEYFCENCGRFIRGNPFNQAFMGAIEGLMSFLMMATFIKNTEHGDASIVRNAPFLFCLVGIFDGIKKSFSGISGLMKSTKRQT